jgi:hypothetical protein
MGRKVLRWVLIICGLLALWVATALVAGAVMQSRVPVSLPPFMSVEAVGDQYALAQGTWVIEGQKQAFPLQATEIRCERPLGRCSSATAQVMLGDQMHADLGLYEIVTWEKSRIVYVDDSPLCVRYVYTIDLVSKSVNGVRTKRPQASPSAGTCGSYDEELRLSLKGGFEVTNALQHDAMPWFGEVAFAPFKLLR